MTTSTVEHPSVCPLDCPDTCSLTVTVEAGHITKIRGSRANPYTAGVLCSKVPESYPEFVHGPGRLTTPLRRTGAKGAGAFAPISWTEALDLIHARFTAVMVSHEIPEIFDIADRVGMLHEGRIVEIGPPAAIQGSQNPIVRQFIRGEPDPQA